MDVVPVGLVLTGRVNHSKVAGSQSSCSKLKCWKSSLTNRKRNETRKYYANCRLIIVWCDYMDLFKSIR